MRTFLRFIKFVVTFTAIFMLVSTLGIGGAYFYFARDLPNMQSFEDYRPPIVSEVFSDDGTKMGEFWLERRLIVKIEDIPKVIIRAFVASEDARFFEHKGVDVRGIGRAFFENFKAGHVVQGGSTITQQVTRSILLSNERSYARKIKEAILATRIDRMLTKKEIIQIYLNQIYLGNRAYGVKAAAQNYYHKDIKDVTIAEAAIIAGLTQAPSSDNPVSNPKQAKERQLYVLQRMYDLDFITKDEMRAAINEPITVYEAGMDKDFNYQYAPYFTEHVRRMVLEKYGDNVLYKGGLKIYTTANIAMNQVAQRAVQHGLEALDHRRIGYQGSAGHLEESEIPAFLENEHWKAVGGKIVHIPAKEDTKNEPTPLKQHQFYNAVVTGFGGNGRSIDVKVGHNSGIISPAGYSWASLGNPSSRLKKGDIILIEPQEAEGIYTLAQVPAAQSALFSMVPKTGFVKALVGGFDFKLSEFNRAVQALRQPGSSFKPTIYSAALDKGYIYTDQVSDSPVSYKVGDEIWTPKNYGGQYSGNTTFASDLIHSRNVPTVKIASMIGTHYITAYARKLGLTNYFFKYLSMALGANSVYLHEMVTAYSTFVNLGIKPERIFVTKIENSDGKVIEEYVPPPEPLSPSEAYAREATIDPKSTELNTKLFETNKHFIDDDKLTLSDEELRILYGDVIPEGYTMTPKTCYLIINLMKEVCRSGTGARVGAAIKKPIAGKTGTTNDQTDAWFIGFVPDLGTGVWIGYDVKKDMGAGEQGGRTAAPIFIEYMQEVTKDYPPRDFDMPEGFPLDKIASIEGGSAIYFTGAAKPQSAWFGISHNMQDRAVDFFEEDSGF